MSDRRNKKGDRVGDGNYLSASDVQLEYRKNEPVTEKLMIQSVRATQRERKSLKLYIYRMMILSSFLLTTAHKMTVVMT